MTAPVVALEEHGDVLPFWRAEGLRGGTVVMLDLHLDLKRIGEHRLAMLDSAGGSAVELATLRRDPPLRDDEGVAYGSDDFLYAAGHLGLIDRFVWVAPLAEGASKGELARTLWGSLSSVVGHGEEVLASFAADSVSARARVRGREVELTTLSGLHRLELPEDVRVDVDLDFFYDPERDACRPVSADDLRALRALSDPETPVTAAYSIAAGHLPERLRWLGRALAETFERPLAHREVLAQRIPGDAPGSLLATASIAALGRGEVALAEGLCLEAIEAGDRATCAAYKLAVHFVDAHDPARADGWLERVLWDLADSVQAHALVLRAACALRLGDASRGLRLARRCVEALPLLESGYTLAALAARALGEEEEAVGYEARRAETARVLECAV